MSVSGVLRVVLDSWQDLGASTPTVDGAPGDTVVGRARMIPSVQEGAVLTPGLHSVGPQDVEVTTLPWSYDLVDPTDAQPAGWGWTIRLTARSMQEVVAVLAPEVIAALPVVDGVRTVQLRDYVGLSDARLPGGQVAPAQQIRQITIDPVTGEMVQAMTDGAVIPAPGLPDAITHLVAAPVAADAAVAHTDRIATDTAATTATDAATGAATSAAAAQSSATSAAASATDALLAQTSTLLAETSASGAAAGAVTARDAAVAARDQAETAAAGAQQTAAGMVTSGLVAGDNLVLRRADGSDITAGNVRGPKGDNAANPAFSIATGPAGSNATLTGSYPDLLLTVPRGADGITIRTAVAGTDFAQGTAGWAPYITNSSTFTVAGQTITTVGSGTSRYPGAFATSAGTAMKGDKFYLRATAKRTADGAVPMAWLNPSISLYASGFSGAIDLIIKIGAVLGTTYTASMIADTSVLTPATFSPVLRVMLAGASSVASDYVGATTEYSNLVVLNLTATFGAGNEPSKEELDAYFDRRPIPTSTPVPLPADAFRRAIGPVAISGVGSPYGVIVPSAAGVQYTDLAATTGAIRWVSTGTTATSWIVDLGDTKTRYFTATDTAVLPLGGRAIIRRIGPRVTATLLGIPYSPGSTIFNIPVGFQGNDRLNIGGSAQEIGFGGNFQTNVVYSNGVTAPNMIFGGSTIKYHGNAMSGSPTANVFASWTATPVWPVVLTGASDLYS